MPVKSDIKPSDVQEILTQIAVLNVNFTTLVKEIEAIKVGVEKNNDDHERRLRAVEVHKGEFNTELASINERMKIFNLAQAALTALAAIATYWFAKVK